MDPDRARLLCGVAEMPAPPRLLTAGAFSAELEDGNLRYVRFGGTELIRAISFLVRGRDWATLAPEIVDLAVTQTTEAFWVRYGALVRGDGANLEYTAEIHGRSDGSLMFDCEYCALGDFETCRTGFVVLHPASVAGTEVRIEQVDGREIVGRFPRLIDPVQPMLQLRSLAHESAAGLGVICRMDGDSFEMEDQRNWSDASFKTYARPLSLPWPYTVSAGKRASQKVTMWTRHDGVAPVARGGSDSTPVRLELGDAVGFMPEIGLGCTPEEARAALPLTAALSTVDAGFLMCRFDPGQGHRLDDLVLFRDLAASMGAAVELQIVIHSLTDFSRELRDVAAAQRAAGLPLRSVAVSPAPDLKSVTPGQPWPPCPALDEIFRAAGVAFPSVPLGGGTFAFFTELNRKRPPAALLDFITFSTSPLVHAADDRSVMESLQSLPAIAASAHAIAGGKPLVVGPSAVGLRGNPYGAAPLPNPRGTRLPMAGTDPRQRGVFNAAWTLGYLARFAYGGATRIAMGAPAGPFGIMDSDGPWPVFPVLQGCAALAGATLHAARCTCEDEMLCLLAARPGLRELWVGNLTPNAQTVIPPKAFRDAEVMRIDADAPRGVSSKWAPIVQLDAYAVMRLRVHGAGVPELAREYGSGA